MRYPALVALMLLALAGCDRSTPPADKIKDAAQQFVHKVDGSAPETIDYGKYAPRDDCSEVAGADEFRQRLNAAVNARDADALVRLAASDVKLGFDGSSGADQLRKRLANKDWQLWDKLDTLVTLGCAVNDQGGITMPWVAAQALPDIDASDGMLVLGEEVRMRATPGGTTLRLLSWDAVEMAGPFQPDAPFQHVTLPGVGSGYVATAKLRSLLDYRLIASSRNGKWRFTSLVSGD